MAKPGSKSSSIGAYLVTQIVTQSTWSPPGGCIDFCDQQSRPICVRRGDMGGELGGLLNAGCVNYL